ncbi:hypothetical protein BDZ97DRAFT_1791142 [Flammula alnicola]|nr:hypothetical protein BDZ97DRAFT_1811780 [Flammula alnicola]KAF8970386.1 hypothetical protein BDZ97DRAFT_1791111 [Flammula alnicola]KAF8970390.1 hypothetical protein BDZ97DRAFT_1791142 [Flammula alnicola]
MLPTLLPALFHFVSQSYWYCCCVGLSVLDLARLYSILPAFGRLCSYLLAFNLAGFCLVRFGLITSPPDFYLVRSGYSMAV